MANFNKDYVKTSVFPREMGRKIGQAEEIRHASDYDILQVKKNQNGRFQLQMNLQFWQKNIVWNSLKNKRKIEMNEDAPQGLKP